MRSLNSYLVAASSPISEAFKQIEENTSGSVFVIDTEERVVGIATDGDIRRWLMNHPDVNAPIEKCMNRKFVSANESTPREQILKLLDHHIHVVPVLDTSQKLLDVVTRQIFPLAPEKKLFARSRAPVRISFGGGGTDLTHYFIDKGGAVMNATVSMYSHATLRKRDQSMITIFSRDLNQTLDAPNLNELLKKSGEMDLILSLLKLIKPTFGFELQIASEFPMGSGLGGSAVVLAAIIGCFNQFREDRWDNYEMAEIAFQAERLCLDVAGGWQDQYATIFGGFNFMEFTKDNNIVHPLRISPEILRELEASLILCFVGGSHQSGEVHRDQKKRLLSNEKIQALVAKNKELTYRQKTLLLRGRLIEFGESLHETWQLKRQFSEQISNSRLDSIYDAAIESGALGGKLLGAGGGGFFAFYVKPFQRYKLETKLTELGLKVHPFTFDHEGLQAWTVREQNGFGEVNL